MRSNSLSSGTISLGTGTQRFKNLAIRGIDQKQEGQIGQYQQPLTLVMDTYSKTVDPPMPIVLVTHTVATSRSTEEPQMALYADGVLYVFESFRCKQRYKNRLPRWRWLYGYNWCASNLS